jgi:hypothetical protein
MQPNRENRILTVIEKIACCILYLLAVYALPGCGSGSSDPIAVPTPDTVEKLVIMSPPGEAYPDPEILQEEALMTFQTGDSEIWLAYLDPDTGTFVSETGKDILIDTGGAPLGVTHNGPEFGLNASGWSIYYAKGNATHSQVWRAVLCGGIFQSTQLTSGLVHNNQLATKNALSPDPIKVMCVVTDPPGQDIVWFSTSNPSDQTYITAHDQQNIPVRWAQGDKYICARTPAGQLYLIDTTNSATSNVSNDAGNKTDPNGWFAPEYAGEMLIAAVLDHEAIAVYKDNGDVFWERIITIEIPEESLLDTVASPEPFVFNGKSYLSLTVKDNGESVSEIWIMGIDGTYKENCGDGTPLRRMDPEVFIGSSHVFVYYYIMGSFELRRWKSALSK